MNADRSVHAPARARRPQSALKMNDLRQTGLDSSSGGECAQRTSRRLEQDPASACTTKAALIARPIVVTGPAGLEPATPGFGVLTTLLRLVASGSIWLRFSGKTTGPFASDPVWLRLTAGLCAQDVPTALSHRYDSCRRTDSSARFRCAGGQLMAPPPD